MKKRSCKMSNEEKDIHEFAVKIRKMTDRQIYDFVDELNEKNNIEAFIEKLEAGDAIGIGPATVKKIKDFAINENYINYDIH